MLTAKKHNGRPGPRPRVWKSGPDPIRHDQYIAWARARSQAAYRKEQWLLTFEQWAEFWRDCWHQRGRTKNTVCLSRRDYDEAWCVENCEIITRREHNLRQKGRAK